MRSSCLCGACTVKVTGDPIIRAICHCESCRKWTGSLGQLVNLYPEDSVTIEGELIEFHKTKDSISFRKACAKCRSCVTNDHPKLGARDVCGGILGGMHEPTMHLHYQESVFPIMDGLPKFKDTPKGSVEKKHGRNGNYYIGLRRKETLDDETEMDADKMKRWWEANGGLQIVGFDPETWAREVSARLATAQQINAKFQENFHSDLVHIPDDVLRTFEDGHYLIEVKKTREI